MKTSIQTPQRAPMKNLAVLARLLEGLEANPLPLHAGHYRGVAQRPTAEFALADPETLQAVLEISPASAQLYQNLHSDHAGLCRAPIDPSVAAEIQARSAVEKARRA